MLYVHVATAVIVVCVFATFLGIYIRHASSTKVGKYHSSSSEESSRLATKGMQYAEKAMEIDDMNFACHKWMGILISWSSEFEGYKRKIERSFEIRDHFVVGMT